MKSDPIWSLDPQLARDSVQICDIVLCQVRLMNDANFPWLLLVPRRANAIELSDLAESDRLQLMHEITFVSAELKSQTACDKINVAAIGNVVPQLHVHVIARFRSDIAWPKPVWGFAAARTYDDAQRKKLIEELQTRLQTSPSH